MEKYQKIWGARPQVENRCSKLTGEDCKEEPDVEGHGDEHEEVADAELDEVKTGLYKMVATKQAWHDAGKASYLEAKHRLITKGFFLLF